jgi:hypothetical protein
MEEAEKILMLPNQSARASRWTRLVCPRVTDCFAFSGCVAQLGFVRSRHMRSLISPFLFAVFLAAGCGHSSSPVPPDTAGGQKTLKDVSSNGIALTRTEIASSPNPASDYDSVHDGEKAQATFSGGDGSTVKDAVVITASNEKTGNRAAYIWLHEHYPGSRLQDESFGYGDSGRYYNETKIVTADGKAHTVFFETTSFFGK